jgi:UDP-N-acetylglucosamine--N-acetylmuramyl-(pentapeptide) pyrophosphoryl-undecaprenol N-acetylglucosamine transferase
MKKKVMIVVGGTGGHIIPSLSLARQLQKSAPGINLMFVGGDLKTNRFFDHHEFLHKSVECGPVNIKNPLKLLKNIAKILKGMWQSRSIIKTFQPDVIIGFGSYYTFPTLLAAKLSKIPIILHEANSIPGKVNKLLSKHALTTGIYFPETASLLKGNTVEVGMPLRDGYRLGAVTKKCAKDYFFLSQNKITLLVFGGSQGAKRINELVSKAICQYFDGNKDMLQVLHFTGCTNSQNELENMYKENDIQACVKDYEKRMDYAWQAADLVISRSGASTIAEQMEFEVPGILIPYPYSSDAHQDKNAAFMTKTVGGAISFREKDLDPEKLGKKISTLLNHDQILLPTMQDAMRNYKKKSLQKDLCTLVLDNISG